MKSYEFLCGGGSWDCLVDVRLTDDEAQRIKAFSKTEDVLWAEPTIEEIYNRVKDALIQQCLYAYDMDYLEEIREEYAESEDDSDEVVVERLLDAEGYVIRIPKELQGDNEI